MCKGRRWTLKTLGQVGLNALGDKRIKRKVAHFHKFTARAPSCLPSRQALILTPTPRPVDRLTAMKSVRPPDRHVRYWFRTFRFMHFIADVQFYNKEAEIDFYPCWFSSFLRSSHSLVKCQHILTEAAANCCRPFA